MWMHLCTILHDVCPHLKHNVSGDNDAHWVDEDDEDDWGWDICAIGGATEGADAVDTDDPCDVLPVPVPDGVETLQQPVSDDDDDLPAAKKARIEGPTLWQRIGAWRARLSWKGQSEQT